MANAAFRRLPAHASRSSVRAGDCRSELDACPPLARRACVTRRGAFTLLELLVAMALTLIMVYAIAEFYSYVGDTVRDGRAIIEMGGNMRTAVDQLQDDLNSLTVRPIPPITPGQGAGFFEYVEGPANDFDVNGDGTAQLTPNVNPLVAEGHDLNNDGVMDSGVMLGDTDDILSMTIRSNGAPFVGRRYNPNFNSANPVGPNNQRYLQIESNLAEVVWFTTFKDLDGDAVWDIDEPRFLVRRVLLIRPDIDLSFNPHPPLGTGENFFHHNDLSAHVTGSGWVANALDDLTQRENRFIHHDLVTLGNNGLIAANNYLPNPALLRPHGAAGYPQFGTRHYTLQQTLDPSTGIVGDFLGEDHVLPNVLAFDVRVYDPLVPLRGDKPDVVGVTAQANQAPDTPNDDTDDALATLQPGDPGYVEAIINNMNQYNSQSHQIAGFGAYVDLWYNRAMADRLIAANVPLNVWPNSVFAWAPDVHSLPLAFQPQPPPLTGPYDPYRDNHNPSLPVVCSFDTWSTYYERDGLNQDGDTDGAGNPIIDEGTDGQDQGPPHVPANVGGVDDATEHETHPPYPAWVGENGVDDDKNRQVDEVSSPTPNPLQDEGAQPQLPNLHLRGIQVRIRLYEPGTRQTRQATVVADFVPE